MKKKILILLFFIFCGSISAQEVLVNLQAHGSFIDHLDDGDSEVNNPRYSIFANTNGGRFELVRCADGVCDNDPENLLVLGSTTVYKIPNPVLSLEVEVAVESVFGTYDGLDLAPEDVTDDSVIPVNSGGCFLFQEERIIFPFATTITASGFGITSVETFRSDYHFVVDLNYEVIPVVVIEKQQYDDDIVTGLASNDHEINLFVTNETNDFFANTYRWQFQITDLGIPSNTGWGDVPGVTDGPVITVVPKDLSEDEDIAVGRKLFFRVIPCGNPAPIFDSNVLRYDIVNAVPSVINTASHRPSCKDGNGGITILFDRELRPTEIMSIAIVEANTNIAFANLNNITSNGRLNNNGTPASPIGSGTRLAANNTIRIDDLPSGELFDIQIIGHEDELINFSGGRDNQVEDIEIQNTSAIIYNFEKEDVRCNGSGANFDGNFTITASGGNSGVFMYEFISFRDADFIGVLPSGDFSDGNSHSFEDLNLAPGTYEIRVRKRINDSEGTLCNGTNEETGDLITEIVIEEPAAPLEAVETFRKEPSGFGFPDGEIVVRISGGTPLAEGNYFFRWRDSEGNLMTTIDAVFEEVDGAYFVTLHSVSEGTYSLEVEDANYEDSDSPFDQGCFITNQEFILNGPEKIEAEINLTESILCNSESSDDFGSVNISNNGEITATVTGGVQFEIGDIYHEGEDDEITINTPYKYFWKKLNPETNEFDDLSEESEVLSGISAGIYALNVEDKNGIQLATYTINASEEIESELQDVEHTLTEPDLIEINFDKEDVYCFGGSDGSITLDISGGTGAYTIEWDNDFGDALELTGLLPDIYGVTVIDENGCTAYRSIEITEPEELVVSYPNSEQPTAFGLSNGWIEAKVIGGTAFGDGSHTFEWTNEAGDILNAQVTTVVNATADGNEFVLTLNNIPASTYFLTITDANFNTATDKGGCGIIELAFPLQEPAPLEVIIEEQTPISCNQENEYGDPFSDGALVANVTGGVPFTDGGLQYRYVWKRQNDDTGEWEVLATQTNRISTNLNAGNYALNIEDANGIVLGNYESNLLAEAIDSTFVFNEPDLLELEFTKRDVFCNLGSDGIAEAIITGGTAPYEIVWNTGETTVSINSLPAGNYEAIVTDSRGCTVISDIDILEPLEPININYNAYGRPSTIGASDAFIEAQITGGTAFDDGSYVYEWKNTEGEILNLQTEVSFITVDATPVYQIRLNDITAGRYFLTIKDKSFELADTNSGCTIIDNEFIIYEPIEAVIDVETPISCNQENEFVDPFSDGALIVTVEGGLPFTEGLPYRYIWKKQNDAGEWVILDGQDTEIATGLSAGNYALNVEDSLGDVIGIYESEVLIEATDSTFVFEEPDLVQVELSSTPISCDTGNNGTATVSISGGIADYEIEWSNGETTPTISNLIAGTYFVFVTDSRGCRATGQVTIDQPGGIIVDITEQINPTCFGGADGVISVNVSGATPPFSFLWDTGETTTSINNLTAGDYTLQIIDDNGCNAFVTITLENPDEIIIDLGEDRTLCFEQVVPFDITIDDEGATYLWEADNGFSSTSPQVEIFESGIYTATITSSLNCVVSDEVIIDISEREIDADFLVTSQAFAGLEVVLVNVSDPIGEITEWTIPDEATLLEETDKRLVLSFDDPGTYEINLRSRVDDCYEDYTKSIIVEKASEFRDLGDTKSPFIDDFLVYPNPSNGEFKVKLSLSEEAPIRIRIVSMLSSDLITEVVEEAAEFLIDFDISASPPGVYILMLETPVGIEIRKIVIN